MDNHDDFCSYLWWFSLVLMMIFACTYIEAGPRSVNFIDYQVFDECISPSPTAIYNKLSKYFLWAKNIQTCIVP